MQIFKGTSSSKLQTIQKQTNHIFVCFCIICSFEYIFTQKVPEIRNWFSMNSQLINSYTSPHWVTLQPFVNFIVHLNLPFNLTRRVLWTRYHFTKLEQWHLVSKHVCNIQYHWSINLLGRLKSSFWYVPDTTLKDSFPGVLGGSYFLLIIHLSNSPFRPPLPRPHTHTHFRT